MLLPVTCGCLWQVLLPAGTVLCAKGGVGLEEHQGDEGKGFRMLPNPTLLKRPGLSSLHLLSPPGASPSQELDSMVLRGPFQLRIFHDLLVGETLRVCQKAPPAQFVHAGR